MIRLADVSESLARYPAGHVPALRETVRDPGLDRRPEVE
jgi:hypothetical protein